MTQQERIVFDITNMLAARIFDSPSHGLVPRFREVMREYLLTVIPADRPFVAEEVKVTPPPVAEAAKQSDKPTVAKLRLKLAEEQGS